VAWRRGETIVHREVWRGVPWCVFAVIVVEDTPRQLVTYLPAEAPFAFPPSADGRPHPWSGKESWRGNGVLMVRRPGDACSIWHFWDGPERVFAGWYVNIDEPFRRTRVGYDTQDLELDIWIPVGGPWRFKDDERLDGHVRDGRYTQEQVDAVRALGRELGDALDRGERWWDDWSTFAPEAGWRAPAFPRGWDDEPATPAPAPAAYRVATGARSEG
jgi:hypothetical protein